MPNENIATVQNSNIASGRALLVDWANQQDHWLRAMVSEILQSQTSLSDDQVEHFYKLLLIEKELALGEHPVVSALEDKDAGPDFEESLTLAQLKDVENVNALAEGQQLTFNRRLTVVFGENATGKSGYARILKGLAAVRTAESILSDISKPPATPKATVTYWLGQDVGDIAKSKTINWNGQQGVAPLTRMDVFDARGAVIHVDGELSYVYTPSDLSLFPVIAESIEKIKVKLDKARSEIQEAGNKFTSSFNRQGPLYSKIETLGASTDTEELKKLATVSEEEEATLRELESQVDALRADNTDASVKVAQTEKEWLLNISKCAETLSKVDVSALNNAIQTLKQAKESYRKTSELSFENESIKGFSEPSWAAFVEASEIYITENYKDYPTHDDSCIYCHQTLSEEARALIKKYRDYCSDQAKQTVQSAQKVVQTIAAPIFQAQLERLIEDGEKKVCDDVANKEWIEGIVNAANKAAVAKKLVSEGAEIPVDSLSSWASLLAESKKRLAFVEQAITELQSRGVEKMKVLQDVQKKLSLLKDRLQLRSILPAILGYVDKAKWADKANAVLLKFKGLSMSLTDLNPKRPSTWQDTPDKKKRDNQ